MLCFLGKYWRMSRRIVIGASRNAHLLNRFNELRDHTIEIVHSRSRGLAPAIGTAPSDNAHKHGVVTVGRDGLL